MNESQKKPYNKPPLSIDGQITLLKERGLIVLDEDQLKYYLRNISYYHLSIYFKFYQSDNKFLDGTTFEDVLRVYTFDNKLRFLLLELLERIEKSFKCRIAYELSLPNSASHCHLNEDIFKSRDLYDEMQQIFIDEFAKSKEVSIDHYKQTYSDPVIPPVWMMVEILSFGLCVKFTKALKRQYKNSVARTFGADEQFVLNWLHCLSALRNNCAHHSRLWNRDLTFIINTSHNKYGRHFVSDGKRLFNYLVAMQIILSNVNPNSSWLDKLTKLIEEHSIDVSHMGFPPDWHSRLSGITNP